MSEEVKHVHARRQHRRDLLRDINETRVLKWIIPPTLFAESSLPEVRIAVQGLRRYEDIEYAIAMYAPGRVTFRLLPEEGSLIPVSVPRDRYGIWSLDGYLIYEELPMEHWKIKSIKGELPEDFEELLSEVFGSHKFKVVIPLEIKMYKYAYNGNVDWIVFGRKLHMARLASLRYINHCFFVDKTSESFPLIFNAFFIPPSGMDVIEDVNKFLPYVGLNPFIRVQRSGKGEVARLVYGYLAQVNARVVQGVRKGVEVEELGRHRLVNLVGVGMPSLENQLVLYGYLVKDTNVFSLSAPSCSEFVERLLDKVSSLMKGNLRLRDLSLAERYKLLLFNDTLYNSLLYMLLSNQMLVAEMRYAYLADVLNTYLIFGQVALNEYLITPCDLNELASSIQCRLLSLLEKVSEVDSSEGTYSFALKIFKKIRRCRGKLDRDRLDKLRLVLSEKTSFLKNLRDGGLTFLAKLLSFILPHTIYHAFIKNVLTTIGGVDDRLLQEGSLDSPWRFPSRALGEMFIFELSDGGIGAVEAATQHYVKDPRRFIDDLIRALGHCVVGVPEELVYYAYLKKGSARGLSEYDVRSAVDELGILVLREELEEASRLLELLKSEHGGMGSAYLSDALEARRRFEEEFLRTPTPDELAFYILKHINAYPSIKQRLADVLTALVQRPIYREEYREVLEEYMIFKQVGEEVWADRFLEDAAALFNGSYELLNFIEAINKKERRRRKFIGFLVETAYNTLLATFSRYFLLTCVSACGWCYLNTKSCEETGAPWLQALTLDRRLVNLYVAWALSEALKRNTNPRVRVEEGRRGDVIVRVGGGDIAIRVVR